MSDYSIQELMIIAAAREIADGKLVFVGMRLPITAYGVARLTHAPNAVGLIECGKVVCVNDLSLASKWITTRGQSIGNRWILHDALHLLTIQLTHRFICKWIHANVNKTTNKIKTMQL